MASLTFLGTGDPLNEERAQTALAVPVGGDDLLLLDTSSGTILLRQLAAAEIALAEIRHILISHRHFDHVGGLAPLLVALVPAPAASVTIYALPETLQATRQLLTLTIPGLEEWLGERLRWQALTAEHPLSIGDATITPFTVEHGIECAGICLDRAGKRLVFSADTHPCPNLRRWANHADLLIHEAYSLDAEAPMAHRFGHSTAADAGRVAHTAAAQRLILTHFRSTAHVNPAALAAEATAFYGGPTELAIDLAQIDY